MDKFFKDIRQSVEKLSDQVSKRSAPPGKQQQQGSRLGGAKPGAQLLFTFSQPGSLGCRVEKSEDGSGACIVSFVQPDSQAHVAGLQRGDIVCHAYTTTALADPSSEEDITHENFLKLVKSNERPLIIKVRRIQGVPAAATSTTTGSTVSANAEVRRKAVIAAAEARERAHQVKTKPIDRIPKNTRPITPMATEHLSPQLPASEETKRAIAAAKAGEVETAAQLGYNPYEVTKGTGDQAKMAIIATTHGAISTSSSKQPQEKQAVPLQQVPQQEINESFDHAFLLFITSSVNSREVYSSLNIIRKLISNATTKESSDDRYRRVRLSNPKIKSAIIDMPGGLDIMLSCGFELAEQEKDEDGKAETFLVYPADRITPDWISLALQQMKNYADNKMENV